MASRESSDTTSQTGVSYPGGPSSTSVTQKNIKLSKNLEYSTNISAKVFNGHLCEVHCDNAVWDTVNSAYLFPGKDFNPGDLQRK